jgi:hypothetical protein
MPSHELQPISIDVFRAPSEWRKRSHVLVQPNEPDRDELIKIEAYLKNGVPQEDILKIFHLKSIVLKRIINGKYKLCEPIRHITPSLELASEILLEINHGIDDEMIQIDWNISEGTFKAIKNGTYKLPKKKKSDEDDGE